MDIITALVDIPELIDIIFGSKANAFRDEISTKVGTQQVSPALAKILTQKFLPFYRSGNEENITCDVVL